MPTEPSHPQFYRNSIFLPKDAHLSLAQRLNCRLEEGAPADLLPLHLNPNLSLSSLCHSICYICWLIWNLKNEDLEIEYISFCVE
jgi:hypothetical protein